MKNSNNSYSQLIDELKTLKEDNQNLKESLANYHRNYLNPKFTQNTIPSSTMILIGIDKNECIQLFNEAAEIISGHNKNEIIGKNWSSIIHLKEEYYKKYYHDHWNKPSDQNENIIKTKFGEKVSIKWKCEPIFYNGDDLPDMLICSGQLQFSSDQEKLNEDSELKFNILSKHSNDWEYWKNPKGEYIYLSQSCEAITGYKYDEFISKQSFLFDLVLPEYKHILKEANCSKCGENKTGYSIEFPILTKNKETKWIEHSCTPVFDDRNKYLGRRGINRDITELKANNELIKKLTTAVEQSANTIVITDLNGDIEYVNPIFTQLTGYTEKEVLGKNPRILSAHRQPKEFYTEMWDTILSGKTWKGEFLNKSKDYTLFWEYATITPITNDKGEITNFLAVKENITEKKAVQKALKQSQKRFKLLSDLSFEGIIIHKDGIPIDINLSLSKLFGYDRSELIGKPFIHKIIPKESQSIFNDITKQNSSKSVEILGIKKNGATFSMEVESRNIIDENDEDITVTAFRDITKRKRNEDIQKVLYNISNASITSKSVRDLVKTIKYELGKIIDTTNFFVALYNSETETITTPYMSDIKDSFTTFPAKKTLTKYVIETGKPLYGTEEKMEELGKAGAIVDVETPSKIWLGVPLKVDRKIIGAFAVQSYSDANAYSIADLGMLEFVAEQIGISIEKKEAERKREESEIKFKNLFEQLGDAVYVTRINGDNNGIILEANSAATVQTGYSRDELLNMNILKDLCVKGNDILGIENIHNTLIPGDRFFTTEKKRRKDNSEYWTEVILTQIDYNGMDAILSINHDITKRKQAEFALKIALEKAEESDRLKTAFLANMSHEIRTPMNGILGFASLLKEDDLSNDEIKEYTEVIERSGNRLLNTINNIMDISKIESGQSTQIISEVYINPLLNSIETFFKIETDKKGLELISIKPIKEDSFSMNTDNDKIYGIFINLIKNAIKYTSTGKVEFGYKLSNNKAITFFVKDTGVGIPIHRQAAIFDRFIQADMEISSKFEGTGLGLSIAKGYIEQLGGKIWLKSTEGIGTTFSFTLKDHIITNQ